MTRMIDPLKPLRRHGAVAGLLVLVTAMPVAAWVLELPASADVAGPRVTLADLVRDEVPEDAGALVLLADGEPGRTYTLTRQRILRELTTRKLADGVVLRGANTCRVTMTGRTVDAGALEQALLAELNDWAPAATPGGPAAELSLAGELPRVAARDEWVLDLVDPRPLRPGRNLVAVRIDTGGVSVRCTAVVDCLAYGEVPYAKHSLEAGEALSGDLFTWRWENLGGMDHGLVCGRDAVIGMVLTRSVTAGAALRTAALKRAPVVRRGETVELVLGRGGVEVTLRGVARQDGVTGQTIPVKNAINGRLVNARVVGPGRVAWR